MKLILEINKNCVDKTSHYFANNNHVMVCPPTGENYWVFRVKLYKDQAVLGFPKYGMIGVGMALEENGNTNLPTNCEIEKITQHIKCNKKYRHITLDMIREAVRLIINETERMKE